jgi:hypothetical protein
MLVMDLCPNTWLGHPMDASQEELLRLLYTRIGMELEDASIIAIDLGSPRSTFDPSSQLKLRKSVDAISALTAAVEALLE